MKKRIVFIFTVLFLFGFWVWSTLAIRFSALPGEFPFIVSGIYALAVPRAFIFLPNRKRTVYGFSLLFVVIIIAWSQKKPSHDRDWMPSVAKLPSATIEDNQVRIRNIRNFDYRTENDFSVRYYDKIFDLNKIATLDYALSYWDGNKAVAHLERGEPQSGLHGFFKQYELIYILGDEKDLLRLRTNFRKEEVFLYPTTVDQENVRKLFKVVIERINDIASEPEFYNTLFQSCLSSLVSDFKKVIAPRSFFDLRRLANGYSNEILFENGWIDSKLSFKDTKQSHHINQYVLKMADSENYSINIRPYLK